MVRGRPGTEGRGSRRLRVCFIPGDPDAAEERAAAGWLRAVGALEVVGPLAPEIDVVWLHASTRLGPERLRAVAATLQPEDRSVRPALMSLAGTLLPTALGERATAPDDVRDDVWHDADDDPGIFETFSVFPHIRGHMPLRAHPLFGGLGAGCYTWRPAEGEVYFAALRSRSAWLDGRAIAVQRSYIRVHHDRATIWEAASGVLCIGAYLYFAARDRAFRPHLERLTTNALRYVAGRLPLEGPRGEWLARPAGASVDGRLPLPRQVDARLPLELPEVGACLGGNPGEAHAPVGGQGERRSIRVGAASGRPFTLAGRRTMMAGDEEGGVEEIWVHPLRLVADFGIELGGDGPRSVHTSVTPIGITRELVAGPIRLTERLLAPHDAPGAVLEWQAPEGVDLELAWTTDLRLMWPYPAAALGSLRWRREGRALTIATGGAGFGDAAAFLLSREPSTWKVRKAEREGGGVGLMSRVALRLEPGQWLRMCIASGPDAECAAAEAARLMDAARVAGARAAAVRRLRSDSLSVQAPDPRVGEAVEWAKYRLDSYRVDTPGLGCSLVAGYWRSTPGWGDGRPGYAWYFGRDSAWTALASLAAGNAGAAREVIEFLGRHQDLSGKILHECSTSGAVHYDAADATPLYLLLVARYHAWTGDGGFIGGEWARVRAAFVHCLTMDRDGDGLIENAGEGHGWIEFGRLGGGTVTFYNAAIWTALLRELADTAESLGHADWAAELRARHGVAREALERTFYDPDRSGYALNVRRGAEREWQRNGAETAMQAVPLLLDVVSAERAGGWLDALASADFAAPWGVRLVPRSDPGYDPASYHGGAVWPLYTGWASWAAYAAGRSELGSRLWLMNAERPYRHERGAWPEVLHGEEERLVGVCPDQAWSTAMAISPFIYGMLGVVPDASRGRVRLRPQLPQAWDRLVVERLRIGDCDVSLRYERYGDVHSFRLRQDRGAVPLRVVLEPALPTPRLERIRVDGVEARLETRSFGERLLAPLQVVLDAERTVELATADGRS